LALGSRNPPSDASDVAFNSVFVKVNDPHYYDTGTL